MESRGELSQFANGNLQDLKWIYLLAPDSWRGRCFATLTITHYMALTPSGLCFWQIEAGQSELWKVKIGGMTLTVSENDNSNYPKHINPRRTV